MGSIKENRNVQIEEALKCVLHREVGDIISNHYALPSTSKAEITKSGENLMMIKEQKLNMIIIDRSLFPHYESKFRLKGINH